MPLDQLLSGQGAQSAADRYATWGEPRPNPPMGPPQGLPPGLGMMPAGMPPGGPPPGALASMQQQSPNQGFSRQQNPQQRMQLLQMLMQTGRAKTMQEADAMARSQGL